MARHSRTCALRTVSSGLGGASSRSARNTESSSARARYVRSVLSWPARRLSSSHVSGESDHFEQSGIYLHPERFRAAMAREGAFVIELRQAGVTLNIRRL